MMLENAFGKSKIQMVVVDLEPRMCETCGESRPCKERRVVNVTVDDEGNATEKIMSRTEMLEDCTCNREATEFELRSRRNDWVRSMTAMVKSRSSIPDRFAGACVDDLRAADQKAERVRRYVLALPDLRESAGGMDAPSLLREAQRAVKAIDGIAFIGKVKAGKTHAAAAICNAAQERLIPSIVIGVAALMEQIKTGYDRTIGDERSGESRRLFDRCHSIPMLVLDDLDKISSSSEHDVLKLYELIDTRYNARLPVILTANVTPNELLSGPFAAFHANKLGEAIVRRLVEMAPEWLDFKRPGAAADGGGRKTGNVVAFTDQRAN